jgi:hypothetical protein
MSKQFELEILNLLFNKFDGHHKSKGSIYIISRSVWGVICSIFSEAAERIGSVDSYTGVF